MISGLQWGSPARASLYLLQVPLDKLDHKSQIGSTKTVQFGLYTMWFLKSKVSNRELLERLESLERRFKTLLADVDDAFDKIRRTENRIKAKSAKIEESEVAEAENHEEQISLSPVIHGLSPRQRMLQAQILKRRAGMQ